MLFNFFMEISTWEYFCDEVVTILVSEVLVKLTNIWMIKIFMNFNLIYQNLLLVGVKRIFRNYLKCSLSPSLLMYTESYLSKSTLSNNRSNSVIISYWCMVFEDKIIWLDIYVLNSPNDIVFWLMFTLFRLLFFFFVFMTLLRWTLSLFQNIDKHLSLQWVF
jgi:hypothetical protein